MRGFAAVFGREIAERRLLFLVALLGGVVPLLLPFVAPGLSPGNAEAGLATLLLGGIVCGALALGVGASVVAGDLTERRLGFYFARPLSGWAIWAGKLGAALALSLGAGLLTLLPALLVAPAVRRELANGGWGPLLAGAAIATGLMLLANVVSLIVRTRSAWLALDLVAAVAVGLLGWDAASLLLRAGMAGAPSSEPTSVLLERALGWSAPLAFLALLGAGAAQVVGGRTDPRRGHRLLSATLWSLLLAGALGLFGYSRWLVAATPADLTAVPIVAPARAGNAVLVQGLAAHRPSYFPLFLLDAESGRYARLLPILGWHWRGAVQIAAEGRSAVWLAPQDLEGRAPAMVQRLDLTSPGAQPQTTPLTVPAATSVLALSPDGRLLASAARHRLIVEELATGRLLASFPWASADGWQGRLLFLSGSRLRSFQVLIEGPGQGDGERISVTDYDLATGRSEAVGQTASFAGTSIWEPSPDGSHVLVHLPGERFDLFAARGGAPLAELPARTFGSGFLADGRVVAASPGTETKELVLLSAEGVVERRFPFPGVRSLRLGGEPLPGQLVVALQDAVTSTPSERAGRWESRLLDLGTGQSRPLGRGLLPATGPESGPASAGSRLFFREPSRLVLLDPASGRERLVAGR